MKFKPFSEEDLLNQNKFTVYLNYLESISNIFEHNHFKKLKHLQMIIQSNSFRQIKPRDSYIKKINSLLRNAWFTEIQLNFTKNNPEFVAYSNHWSSVQSYYATYLATRALFTAMNHSCQGNQQHACQ